MLQYKACDRYPSGLVTDSYNHCLNESSVHLYTWGGTLILSKPLEDLVYIFIYTDLGDKRDGWVAPVEHGVNFVNEYYL